jgi:hypothetical protein
MSEPTEADLIARSARKLDRETFTILFKLTTAQPWLERRQSELLDTMDVCTSVEEQSLLCDLLYRFTYLFGSKLEDDILKIIGQLADGWLCSPDKTMIVAINRSNFSDSSQSLLWHLKPAVGALQGWGTNNFVAKMNDAVTLAGDRDTIVLVDEFVGTGETMAKAIEWLQKKLEEIEKRPTIYVCVLAAMEASRSRVEKTGVAFFSANWLRRGISDYYSGTALRDAVLRMERLETELQPKIAGRTLKKYLFGYKRSESLYCLEHGNTPNNVFPVFWWPELKGGKLRNPLLRRL